MAAPPAAAKATAAEARERGVLARAALLRGSGEWISAAGLAQRKAYLAAKVRGEERVFFLVLVVVDLPPWSHLNLDLFRSLKTINSPPAPSAPSPLRNPPTRP